MLDYARDGVSFVRGKARADLDTNRMLQLALVHAITIIGEAARRVSKEGQARYPDVPWHAAMGARNQIIHAYDFVDYDIVWRIATVELPRLITILEGIFPGHES